MRKPKLPVSRETIRQLAIVPPAVGGGESSKIECTTAAVALPTIPQPIR